MNSVGTSAVVAYAAFPPRAAANPDAPAPVIRHVSSLDALRAFAIAPVLAVHAGVPGFKSGALGVDLFFVLSGFLITRLLLGEWDERAALSLKNFWIRRLLRLMPAYYLYALGITAAIWLWPGSIRAYHGSWSPSGLTLALWCYAMNYVPKGGIWNGQDVIVHLWSLAVEEQYYLFWPIVLWGLLQVRRLLLPVTWMLVAAVATYFMFCATEQARDVMLYGRGMSLFLASAVAITLYDSGSAAILQRLLRFSPDRLLTAALLGSVLACALGESWLTEGQLRHFLLPELLVLYVAAVARLWYGPPVGRWKRVLSHPALVYIGKISYGIYLYHEVVRVFTWWATGPLLSGAPRLLAYGIRLTFYISLSIALAAASFKWYEQRFLALRRRFR